MKKVAKGKKKTKSPSRKRYEENNPTVSFRVSKELKERLLDYLDTCGQSFGDLCEGILDRDQPLTEKKLDALVHKKFGALEDRLRYIDDLLNRLLCEYCIEKDLPAICPRCRDKEKGRLFFARGYEMQDDGTKRGAPSWKCAKCGWYLDIHGRIDPKSLKWDDPEEVERELRLKKRSRQ